MPHAAGTAAVALVSLLLISHSVQLALLVAPHTTPDEPYAHAVQLATLVAPGAVPYEPGGQ